MTTASGAARSRGFTIVEAAVAVAVTGILAALATMALSGWRQADRFATCSGRLGTIGAGNGQFALAHHDLMVGFWWKRGGANSQYPDLNALQATDDHTAHAAQAVDFLRRRGRTDMPAITGWFAQPRYSLLPLTEFEGRNLADPYNICPSDDFQNKWRRWPAAFDQGRLLPFQPEPTPIARRWPYASTYTPTMSAVDLNQSVLTQVGTLRRFHQHTNTHSAYNPQPNNQMGPSPMSLVAFPAQKVHFFEEHQRHMPGVNLYFMYPQATLPILFFDGSVRVRTSADARGSWIPLQPGGGSTTVVYTPRAWEPPLASGQPAPATEVLTDPYRWTRDGLLGWDFQN